MLPIGNLITQTNIGIAHVDDAIKSAWNSQQGLYSRCMQAKHMDANTHTVRRILHHYHTQHAIQHNLKY